MSTCFCGRTQKSSEDVIGRRGKPLTFYGDNEKTFNAVRAWPHDLKDSDERGNQKSAIIIGKNDFIFL